MNTRISSSRPLLSALAAAFFLGGCAVGPDYQRPFFELPGAWLSGIATPKAAYRLRKADAAGERWWLVYADPVLDRLIDEALEHNAEAKIAAARVLEARAQAQMTDTDRFPSVTAGFSGNRTGNTLVGAFPRPDTLPRTQNSYRATLDASYEIDLWGKYSRASEAARADLLASEAAQGTVRQSLTTLVAQQYFALIAADEQVSVARRTLASREETLALFSKRLEAGALSEYALHQAEAELAASRSQAATLQQARDRAESTLALLLGRSPRAVMEGSLERGNPPPVVDLILPAGLPSDLLLRRPDLREAEARLMAANARIGAARAQYFPTVGLTAYLGSESVEFSKLFSGPAGIFQFAAAITQPIWNAGRIGANVDISEARREQFLAQYQQSVASAFKDVRDALAAQEAARETLAAETARSAALGKALVQAGRRFEAGIASRLDVLDVERNLLAAELARIESERARKGALADLFKALGGGWADNRSEILADLP